jgi:hypothetical protein
MSTDVAQLYEEIVRLEREQQDIERRLKEIEYKERKVQENNARRKKRNRSTFEEPGPQSDSTTDLNKVEATQEPPSDDTKNAKERPQDQSQNSRDSRKENTEDPEPQTKRFRTLRDSDTPGKKERDNRKLASAVVSSESTSGRQVPTLPDEVMARNRKMFSVLLGTLNTFKESLHAQEQSETVRRRKEIEAKVQFKVMQEHEQILDQQRKELQAEKARELARKEELDRLLSEKELALWKITWDQNATQRNRFMKTQTSPAVYFAFAKYDTFTCEIYKNYTGHDWSEVTHGESESADKMVTTVATEKKEGEETVADTEKEREETMIEDEAKAREDEGRESETQKTDEKDNENLGTVVGSSEQQ